MVFWGSLLPPEPVTPIVSCLQNDILPELLGNCSIVIGPLSEHVRRDRLDIAILVLIGKTPPTNLQHLSFEVLLAAVGIT